MKGSETPQSICHLRLVIKAKNRIEQEQDTAGKHVGPSHPRIFSSLQEHALFVRVTTKMGVMTVPSDTSDTNFQPGHACFSSLTAGKAMGVRWGFSALTQHIMGH